MNKRLRSLNIPELRAYYAAQSPIRCALFGHRISGILLPDMREECFRCGGTWPAFCSPPSLFQWYYMRPTAPIRRFISDWKWKRWVVRFWGKNLNERG